MKDFQHSLKRLVRQSKEFVITYRIYVFLCASILLVIILFLLQLLLQSNSLALTPLDNPFPYIIYGDLPVLSDTYLPQISAKSAFIMDDTSRVVLFSKNEDLRLSPASTTKIMTALVALDYYKPQDILTVQRFGVEPVVVGFPLATKVRFADALYAMLLPSGNDVAYMIADNYPGGLNAFVAAMNQKAKLFHLTNTHYEDPAGLVDDEDYTTVKDLAILASIALENPTFAKVVDTKEKIITDVSGTLYKLESTNKLLGLYGVTGVKTGYTGEAGEVLVTSSVIKNHTILFVVMKSDDRFLDTEKLLQLVTNKLTYLSIEPQ